MAAARKTTAKKAEPVVEAPVVEDAPETPEEGTVDDVANPEEVPGEDADREADLDADPETQAETEAPRKSPAAAELDAPVTPAAVAPAPEKNYIADNSGLLSVSILEENVAERRELYDYATGQAPDPDAVFDLEFPHGQSILCQVRLCENYWGPGMTEPISRLVIPAGQRIDRTYAERIVAVLKEQAGAGEPAPEQD